MPFPMIDVRATGQNIHHLLKQRQISIRTLQAYFGFDSPRAIYRWLRGENLPTAVLSICTSRRAGMGFSDCSKR